MSTTPTQTRLKPNGFEIESEPRTFNTRPREDLDLLFHDGTQGFAGADGDLSLDIGGGRSLWFFGDTLIGPRIDPKRLTMPRNTVGIRKRDSDGQWGFKYYWREKDVRPADFIPSERKREWLWPGSACWKNGKIFFFLRRIKRHERGLSEAFRFRYVGPQLLRVDNSEQPPDCWKVFPIETRLARGVIWCSACFAEANGFVHVWGIARGRRKRGIVAARCRIIDLEHGRGIRWEYLHDSKQGLQWTNKSDRLHPLFSDSAAEISLSYFKEEGFYLAVYGNHAMDRIGFRVSRSLEGPWGAFRTVYIPPEVSWHERYFCYAPKAHPEMGLENGELLITYITNSHEVQSVCDDPRIYYPRFIAVPVKEIIRETENLADS